jgi:hypothetical protein
MDPSSKAEDIVRQLQEIREKHGEAAYKSACKDLARKALHIPQSDAVLKRLLPDLDIDELRAEGPTPPPVPRGPDMPSFGGPDQQVMLQMLQGQIPSMKTQGQLKVFMGCFNALRLTLDGYFGGQTAGAEIAREGLNKLLDMARGISGVTEQLREVPVEAQSEVARKFHEEVHPPVEGGVEEAVVKDLLSTLAGVPLEDHFKQWYMHNRNKIEQVKTPELRNKLFDAIRARALALKGSN